MPKQKRRSKIRPIDVKMAEARNSMEAMNYMWIGFSFFLRKHTYKTVIAMLLFSGSTLYIVYDQILPPKAKIQEATPITSLPNTQPSGFKFDLSFVNKAYSGEDGKPIVFDGKTYGYEDTDVIVKKLQNQNTLLIYNKVTKKVYSIELSTNTKF